MFNHGYIINKKLLKVKHKIGYKKKWWAPCARYQGHLNLQQFLGRKKKGNIEQWHNVWLFQQILYGFVN